jgi:hypothetical protein
MDGSIVAISCDAPGSATASLAAQADPQLLHYRPTMRIAAMQGSCHCQSTCRSEATLAHLADAAREQALVDAAAAAAARRLRAPRGGADAQRAPVQLRAAHLLDRAVALALSAKAHEAVPLVGTRCGVGDDVRVKRGGEAALEEGDKVEARDGGRKVAHKRRQLCMRARAVGACRRERAAWGRPRSAHVQVVRARMLGAQCATLSVAPLR